MRMRLPFAALLSTFLLFLAGCDTRILQDLAVQPPSPVYNSSMPETARDLQNQQIDLPPHEYYELYAAPTSCAVTPMVGNERRRGGFPAWWLDGSGIAAGNPVGVLFVGGNKIQWQLEEPGTPTISGERLDTNSSALEVDVNMIGPYTHSSILLFPTPGCWRLHAEAGAQSLEAIVYVYPESCRPKGMRTKQIDPQDVPCRPPG